jgi:outer membrane protein
MLKLSRNMKRYGLSLAVGLLVSSSVSAETILQAYEDGYKHDPTFLNARATAMSNKQAMLSAYSAFFPQLSVSTNTWNSQTEKFSDKLDYVLSAQQVIFNWSSIRQLSQASAQVRQAVESLSSAEQNLMVRSSESYLDVVQQKQLLAVTRQQLLSMNNQLKAVHERFKVGHATITDIERVRATYDLYRSQLMTGTIRLNDAKQNLAKITGRVYKRMSSLVVDFKLIKPQPNNIYSWIDKTKVNNLSIKAAEEGVVAAKANIGVNFGKFFPSLYVTGKYYQNAENNPYDAPGEKEHEYYSLDLSYNAFQGGMAIADYRRAKASYKSALAQRDAAYQSAVALVNSSYIGILDGVAQLKAERLAVKSNKSALKHTEEGYIAGTQTVLDVLDQQTKLFEAERTYIAGRVAYLKNILRIDYAAGTLTPKNVAALQGWLTKS